MDEPAEDAPLSLIMSQTLEALLLMLSPDVCLPDSPQPCFTWPDDLRLATSDL